MKNIIQIKSGTKNCVDVSVKNPTKHHVCVQGYILNFYARACEIDKYLKSIIDDSVVKCDEIIVVIVKSYDEQTNFNKTRVTCKIENCYILLTFSYLRFRFR